MDHCSFYGLLCGIFFWEPVARMVRAFTNIMLLQNFKTHHAIMRDGLYTCVLKTQKLKYVLCRASLMSTSAILGLGGSPLWSAKCTYLTISGNMQAQKDNKKGQDVINQYFGVFFFIFQSSAVWGNLMSSLIFGQDSNIGTVELNTMKSVCICLMIKSALNVRLQLKSQRRTYSTVVQRYALKILPPLEIRHDRKNV